MKLTVEERILCYGLFPQQSSYELLKAFQALESELRFNEEETRQYDIAQVNDDKGQSHVTFNKEVAAEQYKEIKMPALCLSYISDRLQDLSKDNQLTFTMIPLYERIVLNGNISKPSKGDNKVVNK